MGKLAITTTELDNRNRKVGDAAYISTPVITNNVEQTFIKFNGTWTDSFIEGFIINASGNFEYDGDVDIEMIGTYTGSIKAGTVSTTTTLGVTKEGTLIPGSDVSTLCKTADEEYSIAGNFYVSLTKGDELINVVKVEAGTVNIILEKYTITWVKLY